MVLVLFLASCLVLPGATSKVAFPAQPLSLRSTALHGFQQCNGRFDLCHLRFDQITLLGGHNAGSYGYGKVSKCFYGNHNVHEVDQLERGVRFLDIDVCLRGGLIRTCHGRGKIAKILRPLKDALKDVSSWVRANPSHAIMLSFGDHDPVDPGSKKQISNGIATLLEQFFGEPGIAVRTADVAKGRNGRYLWPKLGDMVSTGRRVVLAYEGDAKKEQNDLFTPLLGKAHDIVFNLADSFHYTYSKDNTADYQTLLHYIKHYCESGVQNKAVALHFDAFLKPFRPRLDANTSNEEISLVDRGEACLCNECTAEKLNVALTRPRGSDGVSVLNRAFDKCVDIGVHVHAVKIDFEEYGDMLQAIWSLNDKNVRRFCPSCSLDLGVSKYLQPLQQNSLSRSLGTTVLVFAAIIVLFAM